MIGFRGALIKQVRFECNNIRISFPPAESASDAIIIRGAPADCQHAKKMLLEIAKEKVSPSFPTNLHYYSSLWITVCNLTQILKSIFKCWKLLSLENLSSIFIIILLSLSILS